VSIVPVHACFYTNWAIYKPEPFKFTPDKIPIGLCTHIFYAFAAVNLATFEARLTDERSDLELHNIEGVNNLKKKQPGLKTLLSFGGYIETPNGIFSASLRRYRPGLDESRKGGQSKLR
ncbi:hypothetical protein PMAYCL1PPCAC_10315, partial [Pristionchus mayeri]